MSLGFKDHLCIVLRFLLDGDIGRKWGDGAAVLDLDDRRLILELVCIITRGKKLSGAAPVAEMKVRGLNVSLPPQHPQDLLLQHGLHLNPSLKVLQPFGVLTDIEALDLLIGTVHLVQCSLSRDGWTVRARLRCQAVAFQVESQAAQVDVVAVAVGTFVRTLTRVQALVKLEVDKLGELGGAEFAVVGLLP